MFKSLFLVYQFLFLTLSLYGQKEDFHWIIGDDFYPEKTDTLFGNSSLNFSEDPVQIYHDSFHLINMAGANSTLSNSDGVLISYSNGQVILNHNNHYIEDTINYSTDIPGHCIQWEYSNLGDDQTANPLGMLSPQGVLFLSIDDTKYCFYSTYNECKLYHYRLLYSKFKVKNIIEEEILLEKDVIVVYDSLVSSIQAVRHGNGKDWWVVSFTKGFEFLLTFLVTESGIILQHKLPTGFEKKNGGYGQIVFSPDGRQLALYTANTFFSNTGGGFYLWDFDRCFGSLQKKRNVTNRQPSLANGVAFSQNSRYLYVANGSHLWQYDTQIQNIINSRKTVAIFDSFYYEFPGPNPNNLRYHVNFSNLKLGPDGRIYIFPSSATQRYLSVIDHPHESYDKVGVRQHGIYMPRLFTRTVPNLPEFRLGPDDGSPCDTLGLDNHPVAKFRYEPDSLNYKRIRFTDLSYFRPETWSWDFGDGSPRVAERYPFHTYTQNGTYEVCLTVSNENSSHTSCRTVTIGTSGSEDAGKKADITLFPNPVSDILLVTLGDYIPEKGIIHIYDPTGRKVYSQKLYYGHNHLDLSGLQAGLYLWSAEDGGVVLKSGKVVKI